MPRPKKQDAAPTMMNLPHTVRALAEIVGDGNRTAGVERLFGQMPVLYQIHHHLKARASAGDTEAQFLLQKMLEYERIYAEAVAEGVIIA